MTHLQSARRRFTHPERIEHLYAADILGSLRSSIQWYYEQLSLFFEAAWTALGINRTSGNPATLESAQIRPQNTVPPSLFSEEELEEQVVVAGLTLTYAKSFLALLRSENRQYEQLDREYARGLGQEALSARRIVLHAQARQAEALSNLLWFLLTSARSMGETDFPDEDAEPAPGLPPKLGHLVTRVNLWSRLVGTGRLMTLDQETATHLTEAWMRRDKLIHPQLPKDLEISELEGVNFSLAFTELELDAYGAIEVDIPKWTAAFERGHAHRAQPSGPEPDED